MRFEEMLRKCPQDHSTGPPPNILLRAPHFLEDLSQHYYGRYGVDEDIVRIPHTPRRIGVFQRPIPSGEKIDEDKSRHRKCHHFWIRRRGDEKDVSSNCEPQKANEGEASHRPFHVHLTGTMLLVQRASPHR